MLNVIRKTIFYVLKKTTKEPVRKMLIHKLRQDYYDNNMSVNYPEYIRQYIQEGIQQEKSHKYRALYERIESLEQLLSQKYYVNTLEVSNKVRETFFKTHIADRYQSRWVMNDNTLNKLMMSSIVDNAHSQIGYAKNALKSEDFGLINLKLTGVSVPKPQEIVLSRNAEKPTKIYGLPIEIDNTISSFILIT